MQSELFNLVWFQIASFIIKIHQRQRLEDVWNYFIQSQFNGKHIIINVIYVACFTKCACMGIIINPGVYIWFQRTCQIAGYAIYEYCSVLLFYSTFCNSIWHTVGPEPPSLVKDQVKKSKELDLVFDPGFIIATQQPFKQSF